MWAWLAPRLRRFLRVWLVAVAIGIPVMVLLEWLGMEHGGIAGLIGLYASAGWEARRARKDK